MLKFSFSLVDDVASHVKLFKKARLKCRQQKTDPNSSADLDSLFFDAEVAMEASSQEGNEICRDLVATIQQEEFMYLQNVSEILLFLLMPDVSINFGAQIFIEQPFTVFLIINCIENSKIVRNMAETKIIAELVPRTNKQKS